MYSTVSSPEANEDTSHSPRLPAPMASSRARTAPLSADCSTRRSNKVRARSLWLPKLPVPPMEVTSRNWTTVSLAPTTPASAW